MECGIEKDKEGRAKEDPVEKEWRMWMCNNKTFFFAWKEVHYRVQCRNCAHLPKNSMFFDSDKYSMSADTNDESK